MRASTHFKTDSTGEYYDRQQNVCVCARISLGQCCAITKLSSPRCYL